MDTNNRKARVIAFYLPQYHPTPQNDKFWGKGFTEWTNVTKAKPLFKGHYQPKLPSDLGFYDLRLPVIREQQAQMAREAGVEGFMYWHYWFGNGVMTLQDIFEDVLKSGKPVADTSLRDTENVPLVEDIDTYLKREVLPYAPDAWIDKKKTKIGYEIPMTRYFYKYQAPEALEDIAARISILEADISASLEKLFHEEA